MEQKTMNDEDVLNSIRRGNNTAKAIADDLGEPLNHINRKLTALTKFGFVSREKLIIKKSNSPPPDYDKGSFKYIYSVIE